MAMLFSKKTRAVAESYNISPEEMAFADLISAGWDMNDAYLWATQSGQSWTSAAITRAARELAASVGIKKRIREVRKGALNTQAVTAKPDHSESDEDVMKALSKENMLKDLYLARKKMTPGSKDWLETNKMIADITRMKQEEVKTEDNTIHYFLPLPCYKCSLYISNNAYKQQMTQ